MYNTQSFKEPETPHIKVKGRSSDVSVPLLTPNSSSPKSNRFKDTGSQTDEESPSSEEDSFDNSFLNSKAPKSANNIVNVSINLNNNSDFNLEIVGVGSKEKPPYSYATLIGMSILTSEHKRMTLAQIYNWVSDNFKYYKKGDVGWQNSIRHNLSLNKAFTKSERSKDGKGHYWQIEPEMEHMFLKTKSSKKSKKNAKKAAPAKSANSQQQQQKKASTFFQQLTPSNSMIQKENGHDSQEDNTATDSYSSEGESKYVKQDILPQKTPKRKLFKIQKRIFSDSDDDHEGTEEDEELLAETSRRRVKKIKLQKTEAHNSDNDSDKGNDNDSDDEVQVIHQENLVPPKKLKISNNSSTTFGLGNIPQLEAPISTWSASAKGESIIFNTVDSGVEKQLPFTSSFNSNLNFDLSPIRKSETGPILEPLTPGNNKYLAKLSQNTVIDTPNRMKTPSSASIMRKIWNSPSYLDDFYTSPSSARIRQTHDDFNSRINFKYDVGNGSPKKKLSKLRNSSNRLESSIIGNISTSYNDFFGVDICSVVKRAVAEKQEEDTKENEK